MDRDTVPADGVGTVAMRWRYWSVMRCSLAHEVLLARIFTTSPVGAALEATRELIRGQ